MSQDYHRRHLGRTAYVRSPDALRKRRSVRARAIAYPAANLLIGMENHRPKTAQRSRKGKRAWRKNVDIDDVDVGLEERREQLRLVGDEDDFVIDTEAVQTTNQPKRLKTQEILTNKSKVKALDLVRNHRKIQGVDKSKVHKLMQLSGRVNGASKLQARADKDGLIKSSNSDIWDTVENDDTPEILQKSSSHSHTTATVVPKTLKQTSIRLADLQDDAIDGGRSYNPSLDSWKSLITSEFTLESQREAKRQELQEFQDHLKSLVSELDAADDDDDDDDNDDDQPEQDEEAHDYQLSINKPTTVKIKTKAQRNKEKRHKQRMELQQQLQELKHQLHELAKVGEFQNEAESKSTRKKQAKPPKRLYKYDSMVRPLDVKLSDELPSNLKNLKPEGNLFYDSMIKLQQHGKIETRLPVSKKRKYKPKVTEKWTYKDFK